METEDTCPGLKAGMQTAVDNCPGRMDAADAEAPRPPRIETAVEFWSGLETVEEATMLSLETVDTCPERMDAADAAVLRKFFWRTRKKNKQKQEAAG